MTPQQADKLLQEIGLFETKSGPEHVEKGVQLIGEDAMLELGGYLNGDHENAEQYLLEKCAEDPYFSLIHSIKYSLFREELIWLDRVLPENALVFDLGCNTGHLTAACARMRPTSKFVGYDPLKPAIDKANRLKGEHGLEKLFFECHNALNIKTDPKPDGLMSLQAIGCYLDETKNIDILCDLVDSKGFIVLIDNFVKVKGLKKILSHFDENGFSLCGYNILKPKSFHYISPIPAVLLCRGLEMPDKIDVKKIRL
jgi:SAM-dependent methyltransferase